MKRTLLLLCIAVSMAIHNGALGACATCGSFGAGGSTGNDVGPEFEVSLGAAQYGQSAGSLTFNSSVPDAQLFTPAMLQFDAPTRTDVQVVTTNIITTTLATIVETDAVLTTNQLVSTNFVGTVSTNLMYYFTDTVFTNTVTTQTTNAVIRQILTPQILADIPTPPTTNGYAINFYYATNVGSQNADGTYQVSGTPFITWLITNSNPSAAFELQISELGINPSYGLMKQWTYDYSTTNGGWTVQSLGGIQETMVTTNLDGQTYQIIDTVQNASGMVAQQTVNTYKICNWSACTTVSLVTNTVGTGASARTTTYTYWDPATFGLTSLTLKNTVIHPDGSWEYYANYDNLGRATTVYSSFEDAAVGDTSNGRETDYTYDPSSAEVSDTGDDGTLNIYTPRLVVQKIGGNEVSRQYAIFPSVGTSLQVQCTEPNPSDGWSDPGNLITTNFFYTSGPNQFALQAVLRPDGTMSTYNYITNALYRTNITVTGQPDSTGSYVVDGVSNVTVLNVSGYMVSAASYDVLSGYALSTDTYGNFDSYGRPQQVTHLDGTTDYTQYACCGLESTTDPDGLGTLFNYDTDKRSVGYEKIYGSVVVNYTNTLDAAGHVVQSQRIGSDSSTITMSQSAYDTAGELIAQTNALNGVTTYSRANDPTTGGLIRTTVYPNGGGVTNYYYADGSMKEIIGTAVHGKGYSYGVGTDANGNICTYTIETNLSAGGIPSSEYTTTYSDAAGRTTETLYADGSYSQSFYNSLGQLSEQIDPDGVTNFYQYNGKGEPAYSATAMSPTETSIDFSGSSSDRITQTTNDVINDPILGTVVRRSRTFVWLDGSSTGTLVSSVETSASGLDTWQTQYRDTSTTVTTHTHTVPGVSRTVTTTMPDGSYTVNAYSYGRLVSSTRLASTGSQIGGTTYIYDAHGRQNTMTDARNGTTTFGFNNADQVVTTTTPSPGGMGGGPQTTTTTYNNMMQATSVTQPDYTTVSSSYLLTGELGQQSGSRTYPVGYSYDYAGRMQTMTNWSGGLGGTGARVTTWNYDSQRGWLNSKTNADGNGPSYTYTPAGRLASRTWVRLVGGQPLVTSYSYDQSGSLANVSYSDGTTPCVTNSYDRLGRLSSVVCNGMMDTLTYNLANELLGESFSGGSLAGLAITNYYDQYLRRTNLTSLNGTSALATTVYGYDTASRLSTVTDGTNNAAYAYLANSPLVGQITFKSNSVTRMTTTKSYDYLNRLTQISSAPTGSGQLPLNFNYNYNNANQRTKDTLVDGSYWIYQYDTLGQVISGCKYWADGTAVAGQQFDYAFDTIGNRTQTKSGGDATGSSASLRTAGYTANNLNQITQRDVPGTNDVVGAVLATNSVSVNGVPAYRKKEYFQGTVGTNNSSSAFWLPVVVTNGTGNSVTGHVYVAQQPEQFSYDADGNLTNDGRWAYTWDGENRLIGMTNNTSVGPQYQLTFAYDAKGRRIQKMVSTNGVGIYTNNFLYDGWNLVAALTPSSQLQSSYMWGSDLSGSMQGAGGVGGLLEVSYHGAATTNCFPAFDGNGNVVGVVNAADGTTVANYEYGPFGEPIRITGAMAKNNPFLFSTKYYDSESGLYYYGHRFYNPSTGTWPNKDPKGELGFILLKDGWIKRYRSSSNHNYCASCNRNTDTNTNLTIGNANVYEFVNNDPLDQIDYLGLTDWGSTIDAAQAAAQEAVLAGLPGGEFAAALQVFGACESVGLALAWAEAQQTSCITAALDLPTGQQQEAAQTACNNTWGPKITLLSGTYNKCKCTK
jgi:RHS repeat-associated protein